MTQRVSKRILNTKEAAEYLGNIVSPRTLERWRNQEKGPRVTSFEGRLGYHIDDLDQYIESCKRPISRDFD